MESVSLITGTLAVPKPFFYSVFLIYHFNEYIQIPTVMISNLFQYFCISSYIIWLLKKRNVIGIWRTS